jgi:hypothetical protein
MQRFLPFLLIFGILGQASIRTVLTLHYQLNRAVYVKNCENKDKPKLHCDGKCYLKKKMGIKKTTRSEAPMLPESFQQNKDLQLFCENFVPMNFLRFETSASMELPPFQFFLPTALLSAIFRPPANF